MRDKTEGARPSLWRRVQSRYDRATLRCLRAEITGGGQLMLQGCERILSYGNRCICLGVCDPDIGRIRIIGQDLVCLSYHADAVLIKGEIEQVRLCRACGEGEDDES